MAYEESGYSLSMAYKQNREDLLKKLGQEKYEQ